jgi:hypothetical protein
MMRGHPNFIDRNESPLMGTSGKRGRKPKKKLAPTRPYVRYPRDGMDMHWRLGGPLSSGHEAQARKAARAREPGRLERLVLRILGGAPPPT